MVRWQHLRSKHSRISTICGAKELSFCKITLQMGRHAELMRAYHQIPQLHVLISLLLCPSPYKNTLLKLRTF